MGLVATIFWVIFGIIYLLYNAHVESPGSLWKAFKYMLIIYAFTGLPLTIAERTDGAIAVILGVLSLIGSLIIGGFIVYCCACDYSSAKVRKEVDLLYPNNQEKQDVIRRYNIKPDTAVTDFWATKYWRDEEHKRRMGEKPS